MKKLFYSLIALLIVAITNAQIPEKISYQAVIRNSSNQLIINKQIGIRITILQGSVDGVIVYSETQTPSTNANGLISIEIGSDNSLSNINWINGPYFIKTETDPNGGNAYNITGVSQILSVPFALYAKNAGNGFSGNYKDLTNQPKLFSSIYDSLKNKPSIKDTIIKYGFTGNYKDLKDIPNIKDSVKTYANGSETKMQAGSNISISGNGSNSSPYIINELQSHYIGELFGGGIIFWISPDGLHGLIMSLYDLSEGTVWSNVNSPLSEAQNNYDGAANTNVIISQDGHSSSAAKLCLDFLSNGYEDWYLPSVWQLNQIYQNSYLLNYVLENDGNPDSKSLCNKSVWTYPYPAYWSSTDGYVQYFHWGSLSSTSKSELFRVRAIRNF